MGLVGVAALADLAGGGDALRSWRLALAHRAVGRAPSWAARRKAVAAAGGGCREPRAERRSKQQRVAPGIIPPLAPSLPPLRPSLRSLRSLPPSPSLSLSQEGLGGRGNEGGSWGGVGSEGRARGHTRVSASLCLCVSVSNIMDGAGVAVGSSAGHWDDAR